MYLLISKGISVSYSSTIVLGKDRTHEIRKQSIRRTSGPVVDVPVIARFINQSVILLQLVLTHRVQVSLCEKAAEERKYHEMQF